MWIKLLLVALSCGYKNGQIFFPIRFCKKCMTYYTEAVLVTGAHFSKGNITILVLFFLNKMPICFGTENRRKLTRKNQFKLVWIRYTSRTVPPSRPLIYLFHWNSAFNLSIFVFTKWSCIYLLCTIGHIFNTGLPPLDRHGLFPSHGGILDPMGASASSGSTGSTPATPAASTSMVKRPAPHLPSPSSSLFKPSQPQPPLRPVPQQQQPPSALHKPAPPAPQPPPGKQRAVKAHVFHELNALVYSLPTDNCIAWLDKISLI